MSRDVVSLHAASIQEDAISGQDELPEGLHLWVIAHETDGATAQRRQEILGRLAPSYLLDPLTTDFRTAPYLRDLPLAGSAGLRITGPGPLGRGRRAGAEAPLETE